ncbi:SGNH/GDSL hydrolase family protein [Streptomyces sp. NPDC005393]|uniref:SGNH/GDSL hydrolase family protein n=2 Tax=unclassified Streptomyces TaxID=2593676 RepID=UPI0033A4EA70
MLRENEAESADPYCLRDGEAKRLLRGHPWRRFVVMGDSVAEGLGDPVPGYPDQPWADRIGAELVWHQAALTYHNLGRRNTRAAHVRATQLTRALECAPDLALVACGGYDTLVAAFDADRVGAEIRTIVTALRERDCTVITVSMIDGSRSPQVPDAFRDGFGRRLRDLSRVTQAIAHDLGTLHIDLFDHPVGSASDIFSADGRHANRRGHAIAAAEAIRAIGAHLGTTAAAENGIAG